MNICGLLIHCMPGRVEEISKAVAALPGAEVHLETPDARLVVTVEDSKASQAGEQILAIHRLPGVVSAALTYHHFEDQGSAEAADAQASRDASAQMGERP